VNLNLYYLIPMLPELESDNKPPLNSSEFLDLCRQFLSVRDFTSLERCRLYEFDDHNSFTTVKEWCNSECDLRNQMIELKAEKLRKDPNNFFRGDYLRGKIDDEVRSIYRLQRPDDMAEALFKRRWRLLNRLQSGQFFNMECLSIYYLKLQLLEERFKYSKEAGKKILQTFLDEDVMYE
jgi:hypothetical protein